MCYNTGSLIKYNTSNQKQTQEEQTESVNGIFGGLAFGVPAVAYGGWLWLVWGMGQQHQRLLSDRLQSTFYRLFE